MRVNLIKNATTRSGGVYLFANQKGCDGERLYFDGCSCIAINGNFVRQGAQFSLNDVEVLTAVLDLNDVYTYRNAIRSLQYQASQSKRFPRIRVNFSLCNREDNLLIKATPHIDWKFHSPMEEIA